jgi:uncharacterized protein
MEAHKMAQPTPQPEDVNNLSFRVMLNGIINRPLIVIVSVTLVTLFFAWQIPRLSFKTSVYDLIIEDLDATSRYETFKEVFGSDEIIRVVIKTETVFEPAVFKKIEAIEKSLSGITGIRRVISLPGVKRDVDASGKMDLDQFADMLSPVALFRKNILSEDHKATAITLVLENDADKADIIQAVNEIMSNAPTDLSLYQIGMPLVSRALSMFTQKDFFRLPPITFLIIAVLLFLLFRNIHCLLLPIVCVSFSLVWTFGFMALTGMPLSMVTVIVPVFLIAVGTAYCLHICTEYLIQCKHAESPADAALLTFTQITFPTALAVITTVIGLGSLLVNRIPAIREFAIFSCFGIVGLLAIVLTLFPAALSLLPIPGKRETSDSAKPPLMDRLLSAVVRLDLKHQRVTLPIIGVIVVFCTIGIFRIRVETNPVGFFKEDIPVSRHFHDIYQDLSGSFPINVVMESKEQDFFENAASVAEVARLQEFLETLPGVDKTISFADYMKLVNYASNRFEPKYYTLPEENFEVRMLLNSYRMMLGEDMLTRFMSPDFTRANILLLTHISSSSDFLNTRKKIQAHVKKHFSKDLFWEITGLGIVISESSRLLTIGQIKSLSITMVIVFIVMFLLFLSSKVGAIAVIPNLFPIVINFGVMGWFGIELSMATSLIASIAIGLAVDDTIHYMVRYNREFKKDLDDKRALRDTLMHMGRPIVFTTITISLGFSILVFSSFNPTAIFGIMMVITMLCALVGDLILLPSLMLHVELITVWDLVRLKMGKEPRHGIPLFKGLSRTQVHYIIMAGKLEKVEAGEVLMRKGEQSDSMYAVISGELDVVDPLTDDGLDDDRGIHKLVHRLKKGDIVGEMGLIRSAPRSATVIASEAGELLQVNLKMISRLQWLYPPVAQKFLFNLMTILCNRLENTTHSLSEACLVDDLTCVCNRRGFLKALETETYRARRFGEEISFGVIKVEFKPKALVPDFESRNRLLRLLGETLSQSARKCDTCGRLDSETFAILMPKTSEPKARTVCDRLKGVFEQKRFTSDGLSLEITIDLIDFGKEMSEITGEEFLEKTAQWLYSESS